jgi:hypothetical protein
MKSGPIQWYALAVCFATLMCFIVALGIAVYDVIEIASPELTNGQLAVYSSDEQYLLSFPDKQRLAPDEIESARLSERVMYSESIRHAAIQSLIFAAIILTIDAIVFGIHWWLAGGFSRLRPLAVSPLPLGEG